MFSFRSQITVKVLGYFFINPGRRDYVNELAAKLTVDSGNLSRKLKELAREGIVVSEERGNQKYYFLNKKYPLLKEVKKMFDVKYGIPVLLGHGLDGIKGLEDAYIFGSFAKDSLQQESDIDLLLIGSHFSLEAKRKLLPVQKNIGREINIIDMNRAEFNEKKRGRDAFLKNIFSGKMIKIK